MSKFVDHQIKFPPIFLPSRYPYRLHRVVRRNKQIVGNKAKGHISKRRWQENKARQIFRKMNISYPWYAHVCVRIRGWEMFVIRKIWLAFFSYYYHFDIHPFALLPTKQGHTASHRSFWDLFLACYRRNRAIQQVIGTIKDNLWNWLGQLAIGEDCGKGKCVFSVFALAILLPRWSLSNKICLFLLNFYHVIF